MVLQVCLRVLQDAHEAEDACQATFLVLARKAGSFQRPELLANWLYGVAYRAARKTQRQRVRYQAHAKQGATMQVTDTPSEVKWKDIRSVIDEEVDRLPDKFRAAVVLCYLEGVKAEQAAQQLGCARGTILSRLARAREQLRERLAKRGVALSASILGLLLARKASASVALSPEFIRATAAAANAFAVVQPNLTATSTQRASIIAQSVLSAMLFTKLKVGVVCLLVGGLLVVGVATAIRFGLPQSSGDPTANTVDEQLAAVALAAKEDTERLRGAWRVVEYVTGQGKALPEEIKNWRWMIEGNDFTMIGCHADPLNPGPMRNAKGEVMQFHIRLDAATRPKSAEISVDNTPCWVAIYELDNDTFRICTAKAGGPRPTGIVPSDTDTVWVLKREPAE
jgi:RNA polymerase sigma factor (sigma-70 family)